MRIGILISGRGSNMVTLIEAVQSGEIPDSEVSVVISNKADAAGLKKAHERDVETVVIERNGRNREEHDAEVISELNKRGVELVCLAGYMRLLSAEFVRAFPERIINIHPSLLPAFPGLDAQKQAFDAGVKVTGCTVHFVNDELDAGEIILQRTVPVKLSDDANSLAERILETEHRSYVDAVNRIISGRISNKNVAGYSIKRKALVEVLDVGLETSMRGEGISLLTALLRTEYKKIRQTFNATDLKLIIAENPYYVREWQEYSDDKRSEGGWWLMAAENTIGLLKTREITKYDSESRTVAEYVVHELDFWANMEASH